jgi:glycosyltransferase involved in cell wall biosynthesis
MISVVIIAKNEEQDLPEALESVKFADEVIVVNDGSTDKTAEVAKKSGAKVFERQLDSYATQRNFGAEQATNDWILSLDADERVTPKLTESIKSAISSDKFDGYFIGYRNNMFGHWMRWGELAGEKHLRLYRRSAMRWERPVHEVLVGSYRLSRLPGVINHKSHQSISDLFDKINRNTDIDAEGYLKKGVREPAHKLVTYPLAKFLLNYFGKLGFLDGHAGFILAVAMSVNSFLIRSKLRLLWKNHDHRH